MWDVVSRIHALRHFPNEDVRCYVKRDDELGCGINGTKLRKYSALIPYWQKHRIEHLIIIAGAQSNNMLAALQIARQLGLVVHAFILKPWEEKVQGNFKLSSLFLAPDEIYWVERQDWPKVNQLAYAYQKKLSAPAFVLEEGGSVLPALSGAMTLAQDIINNEKQIGVQFDFIFIDAGTGFSAAGLLHGLKINHHPAQVYVLLLADKEPLFIKKMQQWLGYIPENGHCLYPTTAKAFGATNQTIKQEIRRMAYEEGILVEPIYSAKLFYEARQFIIRHQLKGNILIIHSGGVLTLPHFDI
ncbi:MAG: 1-aminocyclopropane-1-carboxylate deaminase [Legionella sp. 40-6]|nr:pyridoxal-phosphate dependent enzyme [Legionella sp.]OJY58401.1 MAG: 1-aminocyclopropane-1-carboxylate deaminase [Legionella sp. 40-6]